MGQRYVIIIKFGRALRADAHHLALSAAQADILKRTQESIIKMLAEKKVDTNVYGGSGSQSDSNRPLKENEQNVKNRARELRFNGHIQRCEPCFIRHYPSYIQRLCVQ